MLRANKRPPLGLNVLFLGRGKTYGDCLRTKWPTFLCEDIYLDCSGRILVLFQFQGYLHSWVHWAAGYTLSFVRFPKSVLSQLFVSHGHHVLPL